MKKYIDSSQVDKMHAELFICCKLLQEQFDYLVHLSIIDLQGNYVLYEKIKELNAKLRVQTYFVLKQIKLIQID